jgi:hypothetical protein
MVLYKRTLTKRTLLALSDSQALTDRLRRQMQMVPAERDQVLKTLRELYKKPVERVVLVTSEGETRSK